MRTILCSILAMTGVVLSVAAFVHDIRRIQIGREFGGQMAPSRIAPEVHAVAALLLGAGVGLVWSWPLGCVGGVAYGALAYLVIRPLIHRM